MGSSYQSNAVPIPLVEIVAVAPEVLPNYEAQYTTSPAVRDTETPSNINAVIYDFEDLIDIAVGILAPAGDTGRSAAKNILYNNNYYKEEIQNQVNSQFGIDAWTYNTFVDRVVNDLVHDIVTTDITDKRDSRVITIESVTEGIVSN